MADALAGRAGNERSRAGGLPARLTELLAARVSDCGRDAWAALAAMAVAGRPLTEDQLCEITGLGTEALRNGLRELSAQLLCETTADGRYRARHALLAEVVAGRLLPGERLALHEHTARALEASQEGLAAEAADHWAAAHRDVEELRARITAGGAAERVFGYAEAAAHWQRAIELSQADGGAEGEAGMGLPELYLRAIDALHVSGGADRAGVLAEDAYRQFAGHPDPATAAAIHERAARFRGLGDVFLGGHAAPGSGIPLITEALRLFDQAPPSAQHAEALFYYGHYLFSGEGRHEDGLSAISRGLQIAESAGATALIPRMQPLLAYHRFVSGEMDAGFAVLRRGRELAESAGDGEAAILIDVYQSDALLKTARFAAAADAATRGLQTAQEAGLEAFWTTGILAANVAEALLHQGRTAAAAALITPLTDGLPGRDNWLVHVFRSEIELLSGDTEAAILRQRQIAAVIGRIKNADWSRETALRAAELKLWAGVPDEVLPEVRTVLAASKSPGQAIFCGRLLVAGMRACADLADRARARRDEDAVRAALAAGTELGSLADQMAADPFTSHPFSAAIPAERATWEAERRRLAGSSDPAAWRTSGAGLGGSALAAPGGIRMVAARRGTAG